jgi:transposase
LSSTRPANHHLSRLQAAVQVSRSIEYSSGTGLSLPWSSGAVEGHVNRIKMLKRQMYGRAGPELLCRRILLAN